MKSVLYARFSPGAKSNCQSAEAQLEQARAWCVFHKHEVIGEFSDEWISGKTDDRPGFQKAIDLTCKAKATMVFYSLSRFARSTKYALAYAERIDKAGANLVSLKEQFDTSTSVGRFFYKVLAALAELEREQIGERTSDAMKSYQNAGRRMGARLPFGYEPDPENPALMVDCEYEKEIIAEILRMAAAGYSYRGISKDLWLNGYVGRREPKFEMKKAKRGTGRKTTKTDKVLAYSTGIITPGLIGTILNRAGR